VLENPALYTLHDMMYHLDALSFY